ncbi:MAG: hypothetical protein MJK04_31710, partial [Psychrosphaera sp.]|nr:hypothetical protein [Psychrosphaera sp.]
CPVGILPPLRGYKKLRALASCTPLIQQTQVTGQNQTQAQLHYARMSGSPWQSVIWSASQSKLLVPTPGQIRVPDAGFQSGKQRRRLFDAKSKLKGQQRNFDKASNVHFAPPEYNVIGCTQQPDPEGGANPLDCFLYGVILDDAGTVQVGVPYTFSAFALGNYNCEPTYNFSVDNIQVGSSTSGYFTYAFSQPGNHSVQVNASCSKCIGYFKWDAMALYVAPPPKCTVEFGLSGSGNYQITSAPAMPTIRATVTNLVPANATVNWTAQINHTAPHTGACSGGPDFSSAEITGAGSSFTPNFNGFYGGDLEVKATCSAPGYTNATTTNSTRDVVGTEPTDAAKGTYLGANVGAPFDQQDARRIACHESGFEQFLSTGQPLYSGTGAGDVGLMQVCFQRTHARVWNWHENVDFARQLLTNDARNGARNWLEREVNVNGATPYTQEMWRREAIHRYNAGCCGSINRYYEWNPNTGVWDEPEVGGAAGYSNAVLNEDASCTN